MSSYHMFMTPFLSKLSNNEKNEIELRRLAWGMAGKDFYTRLDAWFANFSEKDQHLALKLLMNLQYYSKNDFTTRIVQLFAVVDRFLNDTGRARQDVLLVVPDDRGDSADKHAYTIIKQYALPQHQIVCASELSSRSKKDSVLIFFNDTHGTGNQFLREMSKTFSPSSVAAVFILAITISEKAIKRFKKEIPQAIIVPDSPTISAREIFNANEFKRLSELGMKIYPQHPVGYGDAALLTSYYFQCPNNSLPLIWANGKNNAKNGNNVPWSSLFDYHPKTEITKEKPAVRPDLVDDKLLEKDLAWTWKPIELEAIKKHVDSWGLTSKDFYTQLNKWFRNFDKKDKKIAYELLLATSYFDVTRLRAELKKMRDTVCTDIIAAGGDLSDVIVVTTGEEQNSVYHYEYELLKTWGLNVDQVYSSKKLSPDKIIDKTIILFYHTRNSAKHFIEKHSNIIIDFTPRAIYIGAYAMPEYVRNEFVQRYDEKVKFIYCEEASSTIKEKLGEDTEIYNKIRKMEARLRGDNKESSLLTSYYFQCPKDVCALIWATQSKTAKQRAWNPLFNNIKIPN